MDFFSRIKSLDTFQKSKEHAQVRTVYGAAVSIIAAVIMIALFFSEIIFWLHVNVENHLVVDNRQGDRGFVTNIDMTFHSLRCKEIRFIAEDSKGVVYDSSSFRLDFVPVMSDSGVKNAACRVKGTVQLRKVAGIISVVPPRPLMQNTMMQLDSMKFNASHTIHSLSFGPSYPGQKNPLDGVESVVGSGLGSFQYYIRIVPTIYEPLLGWVIDTNQFSVNDLIKDLGTNRDSHVHQGLFFRFDFSPIMVHLKETRRSILSFLTSLCALLGGVYAISGIINQVFYRAMESRKTK